MPKKTLGATLTFSDKQLGRSLRTLPKLIDGKIHAIFEYQGTKSLTWMKTTAPWTDRTGNARNGLGSEVFWVPLQEHTLRLFHRVAYGIWLEVRWAGKYAIIKPAIEKYGPDTMRLLNKLMSRLGGGAVP